MDILRVEKLNKSFRATPFVKPVQVLKSVSFSLKKGRVTGFIGANGAGKTTTIKCLLGLIHPDSGVIDFFGRGGATLENRARLGFLPERPYFYEYLSGEEFLSFYGDLSLSWSKKEKEHRISEILELVDLIPARKKALRDYSKGMLQRIGIAQALIHKPEFVILDEPMTGLDPDGRLKVSAILESVAQQGTTVFYSSHLLNDTEKNCDDLLIMRDGSVAFCGPKEQLLQKFQKGFSIQYVDQEKTKTELILDSEGLQKRIDDLRREKKNILEVKMDRLSLDEAFRDIVAGKIL